MIKRGRGLWGYRGGTRGGLGYLEEKGDLRDKEEEGGLGDKEEGGA